MISNNSSCHIHAVNTQKLIKPLVEIPQPKITNQRNSFTPKKTRPSISQILKSVGPYKRISARRTRAITRAGCKRTVFEGHGKIYLPIKNIQVPSSTTITLYTGLGCGLQERVANAIANNDKLPSSLRFKGTDFEGDHLVDVYGGKSRITGSRRTYTGGEWVPNLILSPPTASLKINPASVTTTYSTNLKSLLKQHSGEDCHWAACTSVRPLIKNNHQATTSIINTISANDS